MKREVLVNGEKISYIDEGMGEVILFIHGNMSSSMFFKNLICRLKKFYRCIALDLPGFGDSSYVNEFHSFKDVSKLVLNFMNKLEVESFYLLGWSFGGGVSLNLAKMHRGVKKIILLSSIIPRNARSIGDYSFDMGLDFVDFGFNFTKNFENFNPFLKFFKKGESLILENFACENFKYIYNVKNLSEEEYRLNINEAKKQRNFKDVLHLIYNFYFYDKLDRKVLIIHGDNDVIIPVSLSYRLNELLPNSILKIYEGCGHSPQTDKLDLLCEDIKKFFVD